MKPRTRLQYQVCENVKHLANIDAEIIEWAKQQVFEHIGFATKTRVLCLDCGNTFTSDLIYRKKATCPYCFTKLKIETTKRRTNTQTDTVAYAQVFGEFQVIRNFQITAHYKVGKIPYYHIIEVLQHWILPNGKREVVSKGYNFWNGYWRGDFTLRAKKIGSYYYRQRENDVYASQYHPDSQFQVQYQKYGINNNLQGITFLEAIKLLPENTYAETLLKAKKYDLLNYCKRDTGKIFFRWSQIKITMRNKYKISDISLWLDYLDLLDYFNKDTHNAHYICPKNLKNTHDTLVKKKRRKQEKEERERKRKKQLKDEAIYQKQKSKFFGLYFVDNNIQIKVLDSVLEVMKEGDILHHCIFTNEYYLKEDSLLLSALVDGVRTETIEVCLKDMKIVQCRGLQNKNSPYHDHILNLIKKNLFQIKKRTQCDKIKSSKLKQVV